MKIKPIHDKRSGRNGPETNTDAAEDGAPEKSSSGQYLVYA
jgi:hypothetical protein